MMNAQINRGVHISREVVIQLVAAFAIFTAGIIHLLIISYHWNHAPAHGIFMAVSGVVELAWVAWFLYRPGLKSSAIGSILAISMVLLWTVTRVFPAPYGDGGPEDIDMSGILSNVLELVAAGALITLLRQYYFKEFGRSRARMLLLATLVAGIALGGFGYGAARASEPLFPDLVQSDYLPHYHHRSPWDTWRFKKLVSQEELFNRSGIKIKQLAAGGLSGSLIDMRVEVIDPVKAALTLDDHDYMPRLVIEEKNIEVELTHAMRNGFELGDNYYLFFPNPQNLIHSGDTVTIVIGDSRSNTFVVK